MGTIDIQALIGVGVLLGIGLVVALNGAVLVTMHKLCRPPRRTYAWALARGVAGDPGEMVPSRTFEEIELDVGRGERAAAWVIEGKDPRGATVVLTPGWGSSKLGALVRLAAIEEAAARVVVWDPPGHGDTPGVSALGAREHEMIAQIAAQYSGCGPLVLMGWSLGGGASVAAAALCAERGIKVSGVLAEAPYREAWTPAFRVMRAGGLPWRVNGPIAIGILGAAFGVGALWRGFDRLLWAAKAGCPVLVLHGSDDPVSPPEDGRAIAAAAEQGELMSIEGGGHNNLWGEEFGERVRERASAFIRACSGVGGVDCPDASCDS